ncbi:MAG: peptide chain release factor 1 [Candidatus Omnitrophica bacterium]|nr:peptide chain release factor 1 [Candidatus Omnitrophota bacterium]
MFAKLDGILNRYKQLKELTTDPDVVQNITEYQKYAKELAGIREVAEKYLDYKNTSDEIKALKKDLDDHKNDLEMTGMIEDELVGLEKKKQDIDIQLEDAIFEKDSDSDRDIIMEIRAGTGGIEAALFAGDLYQMYLNYADQNGWKCQTISANYSEKNGLKEMIFSISGINVYGRLKFESGTHRVQRVPVTEASGRIHTSAATVAVLPKVEDVDIEVDLNDLKIDTYRSSGAGGQHVNVTDSAIRITHLPTGVVVTCQDERSQHKNKAKAMSVLRARLYEERKRKQRQERANDRKAQVGSGDRSEKIRTYNFPENRVTDHRIGFTIHKLDAILEGDIDDIIDALKEEERRLRRGQE